MVVCQDKGAQQNFSPRETGHYVKHPEICYAPARKQLALHWQAGRLRSWDACAPEKGQVQVKTANEL
jgi:hypothetical protein